MFKNLTTAGLRLGLRFTYILIAFAGVCFGAETPKEQPVGLVLSANGSKLLRADTETALAARAGDLLFSGDGLRTDTGAASFLFCPSKTIETLAPSGEVRLDAKLPKVKTGKISEQPARACTLPTALRIEVASQQHYGVTMTRGALQPEVAPVPRDQLAANVKAEIAPFEAVLAADPKDQGALVSEAAVFEKNNLPANALEVYGKLRDQWPEAVWVKSKIFNLQETLATQAASAAATGKGGKTYALLVGISKYKKPELSLQFAHEDASLFDKVLESPLGGGLPPDQIQLLINDQATTAAVRNGFQDFLKRRAGKDDTVVILVAGHGTVEVPGSKNAFILTYDSDPQDLASTALPMTELSALFDEQLTKVGRVLLFVDVCKAGTIGTIQNTSVSSNVQQLGDAQGDLFGLLASRPKEFSLEGPQFGGGHGVFSYFVVKGLEGAADFNKDGVVDADELIKYVSEQVPANTDNKQHPREFGTYENSMKLSDLSKQGVQLTQFPVLFDSRRGEPLFLAQNATQGIPQDNPATVANLAAFNASISAGRLLPGETGSAFQSLQALQSELTPERYMEVQNRLRVALENRAQEVLLRYLAGDQNPQAKDDFAQGARYMEAARRLTQESLFLEGRENFFDGRALLFDKNFPSAAAMLEQSVRIDPGAAYAYNALGIAYLEQAQYDKAIPAFRDAARRAQHWSYPLHNEALAYKEMGDYAGAIRAYQQAMRLTPQYSYLPYNLGLVYQQMNRKKDAETSYRKAMMLAPDAAEPYNALGSLKVSEGKPTDAEQLYRTALQKNPAPQVALATRYNLGLLLVSEKSRHAEALALWRANLTQSPDDLPSLIKLAETLAQDGDTAGSIAQYRRVLALKPDYPAAHLAIAQVLAKNGDAEGALTELRSAAASDPKNPGILEQIGDVEAGRGRRAEARTAYQSALGLSPDSVMKKRLNQKLKMLPK
jgi:protein O-mannosyl-transferase